MQDIHTHFIPKDVLRWIDDNNSLVHFTRERGSQDGYDKVTVNHEWPFTLNPAFVDEERFKREQQQAGIDQSLVSPLPQLFMYGLQPEVTTEFSRVYNDGIIAKVQENASYLGLATLPLNSPEAAALELNYAMRSGLKGAIIGTSLSSTSLTDHFFQPVWEEANKLGAILFIHPLFCKDERVKQKKMAVLSGVLWETTVCATDILLHGYLDKYPNVKIILAHGGGFLPYQIGRLNKGYEQWKEVAFDLENSPEEYLKRFWFDSVLWSDQALEYLESVVGKERILPGSDYPFEIKDWPPRYSNNDGWKELLHTD